MTRQAATPRPVHMEYVTGGEIVSLNRGHVQSEGTIVYIYRQVKKFVLMRGHLTIASSLIQMVSSHVYIALVLFAQILRLCKLGCSYKTIKSYFVKRGLSQTELQLSISTFPLKMKWFLHFRFLLAKSVISNLKDVFKFF